MSVAIRELPTVESLESFGPWLIGVIARDASLLRFTRTYVRKRYKVASNAAIIARLLQLTVNSFSKNGIKS